MNSFGTIFRVTIWGESHGSQIGVSIDGIPAGIPLTESDFDADLGLRRAGKKGTTPRIESDVPHIVSGVFEGKTSGSPLTIIFFNENAHSDEYTDLRVQPRPSHADFSAAVKHGGHNDYRGAGHFSGRITIGMVAAGVVAKKILGEEVLFRTSLVEVGGVKDESKFSEIIADAAAKHDSVGGVVCSEVSGIEAGLGEPFFDSVESVAAHLLFAIPGIKGVEFGSGFEGAKLLGSENNDCFIDANGRTATNNAGGVNGGITNGNPVVVRVAFKPTPTISRPQMTFDFSRGEVAELVIKGRHDICIALRAGVVVEAAMAIALADLKLRG